MAMAIAAPASGLPFHFNAVQVGTYFVQNYYNLLQQQPSVTYQFYSDNSSAVRVHGSVTETAGGMIQINALIMSLNVTKIEIKTANFLTSWANSIIVMVSGIMHTTTWSAGRNFAQSFVLAPQENGFFILSDFFYFDDEDPKIQPALEKSEKNLPELVKTVTASEYIHEEENQSIPRNVLENGSAAEYEYAQPVEQYPQNGSNADYEYSDPQHEMLPNGSGTDYNFSEPQQLVILSDNWGEGTTATDHGSNFLATQPMVAQEHVAAPVEESAGEQSKKSYASILRTPKGPSPYPDVHMAPKPAKASGTNQAQPSSQQAYPAEKSSSEAWNEVPYEEEVSLSVYVGNVPPSLSESDLYNEFKKFGTIIPDGVAIRSRKETGGRYAFVEYVDVTGVQNALKAYQVEIGGKQLYVEERRPNSGANGGGRRGRGRMGNQSEAPRGNNGGGGRYPRKGGADNANYSNGRARGNGYYQRNQRGVQGRNGSDA